MGIVDINESWKALPSPRLGESRERNERHCVGWVKREQYSLGSLFHLFITGNESTWKDDEA